MDNSLSLAAIRGVQGQRAFYVAMMPYAAVATILAPLASARESRIGRALNKARVKPFAQFLTSNSPSVVVPSIHVAIDGCMGFEEVAESISVGTLKIALDAPLMLIDGRHRVAAIAAALGQRPYLDRETLPVCFHAHLGPETAQQMFDTINRRAIRPPRQKCEV